MAGELHGDALGHAGSHEGAHGRAPEVVRNAPRTAGGDPRPPPRLVEAAFRDPLAGLLARRVAPRKEETPAACATPGFVLRYDQIGRIFETLMLRLSKKTDYALMAMKHLASDPRRRAASAREIAESYDIPIELMA